ncbi:MAG: M3 family metallopeptidase [Bacteroidales bacterium]
MIQARNNLLLEFKTPHSTPPFEKIEFKDYKPTVIEAIKKHQAEIDAITSQKATPDFENTIVALDRSGRLLESVTSIFFNLLNAESNDQMIALSQELSPILSEHSNNISLNEDLFDRIKSVYDKKASLSLTREQRTMLEDAYKSMQRKGANLKGEERERYRELTAKLDKLTLTYGQNLLKATNNFEMVLTDEADLAGLPESVREGAMMRAAQKEKEGYLFNLSYPSYVPFMKYSSRRDLREKLYRAYNSRSIGGEFDNSANVRGIVETRKDIAELLGFKDWASYVLDNRMAKNSERVYDLLDKLLAAYKPMAEKEIAEIREFALKSDGANIEIMPWDWSYYSEKLKDAKYDLNDEMLKPYFELEKVKNGVFGLATRLYGLKFKKNTKIPIYHKDVEAFEVFDATDNYVGVLYTDYYPRDGKQGGAWMTSFKGQWHEPNGTDSRPQISLVMNFSRPTKDKPALLTYDEANTFLHEFGHSLHGLLSKCTYSSLSGTSVYRDFVELPSQIMENWLDEKEFLDTFAVHYETGERMPQELIEKIVATSQYHAGYFCLRQLTFCYLDMAWHTLQDTIPSDISTFERNAMSHANVFPAVDGTGMSCQFGHIFDGGYSAGYYSYKWAEVLDADAFSLFKKNGIFDRKTADSFRINILERGGSDDPMTLYKNFRGQEPTIDALMQRDGVK